MMSFKPDDPAGNTALKSAGILASSSCARARAQCFYLCAQVLFKQNIAGQIALWLIVAGHVRNDEHGAKASLRF